MSFYLRKSFRIGPIRLNLSKSGVGVSAGVRGARVGVSGDGRAYVHGGRHGLYYRKYASSGGRGQGREPGAAAELPPAAPRGGSTVLYEDTGVTYARDPVPVTRPLRERLVRTKRRATGFHLLPALAVGACAVDTAGRTGGPSAATVGLMALLLAAWIAGVVWARRANGAGDRLGRALGEWLGGDADPGSAGVRRVEEAPAAPGLTASDRDFFGGSAYVDLLQGIAADRRVESGERKLLERLEALFDLDPGFRREAKLEVWREAFFEAVCDESLSESEEAELAHLRGELGVPEEELDTEREVLGELRDVRAIRAGRLPEVEPTHRLKEGERCFYEGPARLLKERTLDRFQRNRRRYRVRGLVIDREGTLYVTDRRVLLVGEGTRSFRLRRLLEVEVDRDRNLVTLVRDGVRTPTWLSTPDALRAGAIIATAVDL